MAWTNKDLERHTKGYVSDAREWDYWRKVFDAELVAKAKALATKAHTGQVRKYTGDPYITHPTAVAEMVAAAGGDAAAVAAAFLHDTLEDTDLTYAEIVEACGTEVADLVVELTDVYTSEAYPNLNRAARKKLEVARIATTSAKAKLVKRYDIAHNTASIVALDPAFAKVYLPEKAAVLAVL